MLFLVACACYNAISLFSKDYIHWLGLKKTTSKAENFALIGSSRIMIFGRGRSRSTTAFLVPMPVALNLLYFCHKALAFLHVLQCFATLTLQRAVEKGFVGGHDT